MTASTDTCRDLRVILLDLHRTLLELERRNYERWHGRQGAGDFLQVVAFSDEMRWLEPLNRLIVMLDEAVEPGADASTTPAAVSARLTDLLALNRTADGSFSSRYTAYFDSSPELAHRHARLLSVLKGLSGNRLSDQLGGLENSSQ